MNLSAKNKGSLTELQCISAFYNLGYTVSIPYGEDNRYDFIADINGILIKVQVKTSSTKDNGNSYSFSCRSSQTNSKGTINKKYTKDEIDYFATYINNNCYLIPVEECSCRKKLKFVDNNNVSKSNNTSEQNYRLKTQLESLIKNNKH